MNEELVIHKIFAQVSSRFSENGVPPELYLSTIDLLCLPPYNNNIWNIYR